jgi:heat shock protein HtpX
MPRQMPAASLVDRHRRHKLLNLAQSLLLLGGMLGILATCAWSIWGVSGVVWALLGGGMSLLLTPSVAPEWVMRLYRAHRLDAHELPEVHLILAHLAERAELPATPALYYLPSPLLNAFAVGNARHAAIAVTDGLLRRLSARELAGVLAHEISHVRSNDLWLMNLADLISRLTSLMSWLGQLLLLLNLPAMAMGVTGVPWLLVIILILSPTLLALLQLALSRAREYDADLDAALLTGDPEGLAAALARLDRLQGRYWEEIVLPGRRMPEPSLLRTHPPTEERIARLRSLRGELPRLARPSMPVHGLGVFGPVADQPRWRWPGVWY